jgi:hypothetical protein
VLWFRGAAAEHAGINTSRAVSWDALLSGADRIRASVQFDDDDGTGLSDWVRALVAESGGTVIKGTGREPKIGMGGDAGRVAAGIVQYYAASGLGIGPDRAGRAGRRVGHEANSLSAHRRHESSAARRCRARGSG